MFDHSSDIMVLRDKMLNCLDYLCRRNQPDGKRMIPKVLATVRDLYSASNEFGHIFSKVHVRVTDTEVFLSPLCL